jgi:hypothetical protein
MDETTAISILTVQNGYKVKKVDGKKLRLVVSEGFKPDEMIV